MIKQAHFIKYFIVAGLAVLVSQSVWATPVVEVFTTSTQRLSGMTPDMRRCNVDEAQQLTEVLNQQADILSSQGESQSMIEKAMSAAFAVNASHMEEAAMCLSDALNLAITQLPAVVVNNNVVVYGEYDVPTALLLASKQEDGHK